MRNLIAPMVLSTGLVLGFSANASDDRPDHFKAESVESLEQAINVFREHNAKLAEVLAGEVDDQAIGEIHILTYTLENALERINNDAAALAETLEELHLSSEKYNADDVKKFGAEYLETATKLVP